MTHPFGVLGECVMKSRNRKALWAASAVVASVISNGTRAATATWDGGGADDFTATPQNWAADVTPVPLDALVFAGATRTTPSNNLAAGTIFKGITFDATASSFTLSGNQIALAH